MLVGLMGQAQSGKDSVSDYLVKYHGFAKMSFAVRLKRLCKKLFRLTDDQLNTTDGKATIDPRYDLTPRTILQRVGVGMREVYNNVWVDLLFEDNDEIEGAGWINIIIADVRFLNEVSAIKEKGGIIIRLVREDYQALKGKEAQHTSETEQLHISEDLIDLTVYAKSGEVEKLCKETVDFLEGFGQCY